MNPRQAQVGAIARISAVGTAYGIEMAPLLERLTPLADEIADFVMVTVPHTFDRVSVAARIAPGSGLLDKVHAVGGDEQREIAARMVGPELRFLGVEVEIRRDAPLAVSLHAFGARSLDLDLARLSASGVGEAARATLAEYVGMLGADAKLVALSARAYDDTRSWLLRIARPNGDDEAREVSRTRIAALARRLGVTMPQLGVIDSMHDVLAKDRDTHVVLRVGNDGIERELGLVFARARWETLVRMMVGFYPGRDLAQHLGGIAGAFDADVAASVELVLGVTEPPGMRIASVLRSGRVPA